MKIVEERHNGESWLSWKLGNLLTVDQDEIESVGVAWGFKENGKWCFKPRITGNGSLYYNALLFYRYSTWRPLVIAQCILALALYAVVGSVFAALPVLSLGSFWSVRWAEKGDRAYWQTGYGLKLNGRFSVTFRVQGDKASAAGVSGPNLGQAQGFEYGPH